MSTLPVLLTTVAIRILSSNCGSTAASGLKMQLNNSGFILKCLVHLAMTVYLLTIIVHALLVGELKENYNSPSLSFVVWCLFWNNFNSS